MLKTVLSFACLSIVLAENYEKLGAEIREFIKNLENNHQILLNYCDENVSDKMIILIESTDKNITKNITEFVDTLIENINDLEEQTNNTGEKCVKNVTMLHDSVKNASQLFISSINPFVDDYKNNCILLLQLYYKMIFNQTSLLNTFFNCGINDEACLSHVGSMLQQSNIDLENLKINLYNITRTAETFSKKVKKLNDIVIMNVTQYDEEISKQISRCLQKIILEPLFEYISNVTTNIFSTITENVALLKNFSNNYFDEYINKITNNVLTKLNSESTKLEEEINGYYEFATEKNVNVTKCLKDIKQIKTNVMECWKESKRNCNNKVENLINKSKETSTLFGTYQLKCTEITNKVDFCLPYDEKCVNEVLDTVEGFKYMSDVIFSSVDEFALKIVDQKLEKIGSFDSDACSEKNIQLKETVMNCIFHALHDDSCSLNPTVWLSFIIIFIFIFN